ncbi:hypothetical protein ASF00_04270 [Sphingomonas sp. Leaf34]|nr:hypothetical protein ASF00_04270 [Sphingomonas sp. Leaf34]
MVALASYFVPLVSPLIASNTLSLDLPSTVNTQLTSLAAAVLALLVFRRVTFYPGARAFAFIVPAFSTAFGVAAVALLVSRISYSGSMLLAGYLASVSVTFLLGYFNQHDEPQRMYYVFHGSKYRRSAPRVAQSFQRRHLDRVVTCKRLFKIVAIRYVAPYCRRNALQALETVG